MHNSTCVTIHTVVKTTYSEKVLLAATSHTGPLPQVLASVPEKDAGLLAPLKELGCTTTHNNMDTVTHRHGVKLEIITDNPRSFCCFIHWISYL